MQRLRRTKNEAIGDKLKPFAIALELPLDDRNEATGTAL